MGKDAKKIIRRLELRKKGEGTRIKDKGKSEKWESGGEDWKGISWKGRVNERPTQGVEDEAEGAWLFMRRFPRAFPPLLLKTELLKITPVPERIYVTHIKPQYDRTIQKELRGLRIPHLRVLKDGETIRI